MKQSVNNSPWPTVRLGEQVDLLAGFAFKSARFTASPNDIPLVKGENVSQGRILWSISKRWPAKEGAQFSKFALKAGDVVLAMDRPWVPAGLKWAYIRERDPSALLVQRVARLRGKNGLDSVFLRYIIGSPQFTDYVRPITTGVNVPHISAKQIEDFQFHLPPLTAQREIAKILSAYDDLIENNARRIKILEEMSQSLYREWFVRFRFPGHEMIKIIDSQVGKVPKGWEMKTLGSVAQEMRRNVRPDQIDPETPYFGLEHLPRKSIALFDWGVANEVQSIKLRFEKGEILFGKIRPYFHKVSIAPISGVCSSDTIVMRPVAPEYLATVLCCVSSEDFVAHATQTSQGTKMPRANWAVLKKYPLALPPGSLLEQFNAFVDDAVDEIQNLIFQNRNLRHTRDLLLPKLISGEVGR